MSVSSLSPYILHFHQQDLFPYLNNLQLSRPLVHCLTNTVVQNFTANMLLAVGASPAMVIAKEEVAEFVAIADSLLINIGTVTASSAQAMLLAAQSAHQTQTPWVLDPVAVGRALPFRTEIAQQLLAWQPTVIRGNASEILALAQRPSSAKGPDSFDDINEALLAATDLARQFKTTVVLTGQVDYVTDGQQCLLIEGGDVMLTRVTGTGCALSALVAAFLGCNLGTLKPAASACALMSWAAERSLTGKGLGSFAVSLLDSVSLAVTLLRDNDGENDE